MSTKYIFVTGGVVSSIGKGITTASLGRLLRNRGFAVTMTKEVMWANVSAPSLDNAIHLENRTQILASTSGAVAEAASAFIEGRKPVWK